MKDLDRYRLLRLEQFALKDRREQTHGPISEYPQLAIMFNDKDVPCVHRVYAQAAAKYRHYGVAYNLKDYAYSKVLTADEGGYYKWRHSMLQSVLMGSGAL